MEEYEVILRRVHTRNQSQWKPSIPHLPDFEDWLDQYVPTPHTWQRAIGSSSALEEYAKKLGLKRIQKDQAHDERLESFCRMSAYLDPFQTQ